MQDGAQRKGPSLSLFAALQFVWILIATLGLWANAREIFGTVRIDEQEWMFGITMPLTLASIWVSRLREWRQAPAMIAISAGLHVAIYFLPLFLLMGAPLNIFALTEIAWLIGFFALLYAAGVGAGLVLFRILSKKEPAT